MSWNLGLFYESRGTNCVCIIFSVVGRCSSVGIATRYGLDGPGIQYRWGGEIFRTCTDQPWGPPSLLYNGYRVFPVGKERPGRDADSWPTSSVVGHERVELYLYSPYGPNGLYRASVPVQEWPLPLPLPLHCLSCFLRHSYRVYKIHSFWTC